MIIVLVQLALFIFIQYHLVPLLKRPTCTIWMLILGGFKCCINRMISSHPMIPKRPGMIRWSRWRLRFGKAFDYSTILTYILTYIYILTIYQLFYSEFQNHWTYWTVKWNEITLVLRVETCRNPIPQSDSELQVSVGRQARATAPSDFGGGRLSGAGWSRGKSPGALWGAWGWEHRGKIWWGFFTLAA